MYLEDTKGTLSFEEISSPRYKKAWKTSTNNNPGFGFSKSVFWIKISLENNEPGGKEFFIEQSYPLIDQLTFYRQEGTTWKKIKTGDGLPFISRSVKHRTFVFPVNLQSKEKSVFYLRYASTSSININLTLWPEQLFRKQAQVEYRYLMLFYGAIIIMIIYNLMIFIIIRRRVFLYYVLLIFFFLFFLMGMDGISFQFIWPDNPWWANRSLLHFHSLGTLFAGLFALELIELRTVRNTRYRDLMYRISLPHYLVAVPLIVVSFFLPYRSVMQGTMVAFAYLTLAIFISSIILIVKEKNRAAIFGLFASCALLFGTTAGALKAIGVLPSAFLTIWSMHIGAVIMVAVSSSALADNINIMGKEIRKAEGKYRKLFEDSEDIIFTLDRKLNFINVNSSMKRHLGFNENQVAGKSFFDFIVESTGRDTELSRAVIGEYFKELKKTGKSLSFRTEFRSKKFHEPVLMSVKIEKLENETGKSAIMGKASHIPDDILIKYLKTENHSYSIDNYLVNAELMSYRLTRNLEKRFDSHQLLMIRLALREMLINSIEHGNLNIQFDEKSQAQERGDYFAMIQKRQEDPSFKNKKIEIKYCLREDRVEYRLTDQGQGFDHTILDGLADRAHNEMLLHGRGVSMAREIFDEVIYNQKGNEVSMVKFFT